ncbi:hypothetical protein Nmel_004651 [Mimus melanotis]
MVNKAITTSVEASIANGLLQGTVTQIFPLENPGLREAAIQYTDLDPKWNYGKAHLVLLFMVQASDDKKAEKEREFKT